MSWEDTKYIRKSFIELYCIYIQRESKPRPRSRRLFKFYLLLTLLVSALSTSSDLPRVDLELESEHDDDDDDNDDDDESTSSGRKITETEETLEPSPSNPTIQIEFAVGPLSENPIITLLADDDDSNEGTEEYNLSNRDEETIRTRAVEVLLSNKDVSKDAEEFPTTKKSLITEM